MFLRESATFILLIKHKNCHINEKLLLYSPTLILINTKLRKNKIITLTKLTWEKEKRDFQQGENNYIKKKKSFILFFLMKNVKYVRNSEQISHALTRLVLQI